jgi:hypothetical protein
MITAEGINRRATAFVMRQGGSTLGDIGTALGVSRERARQLIVSHDAGKTTSVGSSCANVSAGDPVVIMRLLRDRKCRSVQDIVRGSGTNGSAVAVMLKQLGLLVAAQRLFAWRRHHTRRTKMLAAIHAFIAREGRQPFAREMGVKQGTKKHPDLPSLTHAVRIFGSVGDLWRAAGVVPRWVGRAGHAQRTHCLKGHEFTPASTYVSPSGQRACRICARAREATRSADKRAKRYAR